MYYEDMRAGNILQERRVLYANKDSNACRYNAFAIDCRGRYSVVFAALRYWNERNTVSLLHFTKYMKEFQLTKRKHLKFEIIHIFIYYIPA